MPHADATDLIIRFGLLGLLGLVVGAVGTFMGAGGGFVLMPFLAMLYPKEPAARLASMSLAVVFFNAVSGSIGYARQRRIDYRAGSLLASATIPGAVIGALVTGFLSRLVFDSILGSVIIAAAGFIAFATRKPEPQSPEPAANGPSRHDFKKPLGVGLSFGVGFLSSLLGIGGGIVHVPVLVFVLRFPVHIAVATSHFVLAITALVGTIVHIANGEFDAGIRRTAALAVGVIIGAQIGAYFARHSGGRLILRLLAVGLILIGARVIFW
jgi:uncharacterized membrane protein YfcA